MDISSGMTRLTLAAAALVLTITGVAAAGVCGPTSGPTASVSTAEASVASTPATTPLRVAEDVVVLARRN